MCIILDANMLSRFKKHADEDIKPVWDWVYNRNGKIAYSTTEKFKEEWTKGGGDNVLKELQTIKKTQTSVGSRCIRETKRTGGTNKIK